MKELIRTFGNGKCPVCTRIANEVFCAKCVAPHCKDCWFYNAGCGVFGCFSRTRHNEPLGEIVGFKLGMMSFCEWIMLGVIRVQRTIRPWTSLDRIALLVIILFTLHTLQVALLVRQHSCHTIYDRPAVEKEEMDKETVTEIDNFLHHRAKQELPIYRGPFK